MNSGFLKLLAVVFGVWLMLKSIPFIFGIYTYYSWEVEGAKLVLDSGDELEGTIRFHDIGRTLYSIDVGQEIVLIPKDNVRVMSLPMRVSN